MKKLLSYALIIAFGLFITFNAALAAERVKVFELAESGVVIEFPMTASRIPPALPDPVIAGNIPADSGGSLR